MTIRTNGNCVCISLSPAELEKFELEGILTSIVPLEEFDGHEKMIYTLERSNHDNLQITYAMNRFRIFVPDHMAVNWIYGENKNLEYFVKIGPKNYIRILIDKESASKSLSKEKWDRSRYLRFVN